jgi:hypothetical protein
MPVIKQTALLKKKQGMGHEAFVARYEEGHAPLIDEVVPFHCDYKRNFIIPGSLVELEHIADPPPPPDFDVITQIWYEDQSKLDGLLDALSGTDAGAKIARDEEDLFDRSRMAMFATEAYETPMDQLRPRPEGFEGPPPIKQVALLRAKPGMSREDFIAYYENNHAPLALRLLRKDGKPLWAKYIRNFPVPRGNFDMAHVEGPQAKVDFDVMSEFWYWSQSDFDELLRQCAIPEVGAEIAAGEENFFDRSRITIFMVDERG